MRAVLRSSCNLILVGVRPQVSDLAAATMPPPTTLEDDEPADDSSSGASGGTSSSAADDSIAPELAPPSGSLPHVERIRLHLQAAQGGLRSERHREVVQYYQYSADRGNTEAQTAVGQVSGLRCRVRNATSVRGSVRYVVM